MTGVQTCALPISKHANPLGCWEAQGKPEYPTKAQLAELELASQLVWESIPAENGRNVLKLKLEPESVAIVKAVLAFVYDSGRRKQ